MWWIPSKKCENFLTQDYYLRTSLAYKVIGDDIYKGIGEIRDEFDFSEYPDDHPSYSIGNMKEVGKFQDESHGQLMLQFVGLTQKLYSFNYEKLAYGGIHIVRTQHFSHF